MPKMTIRQLNNELLNPSGPQIDVRDVFTPGDGTTWQDLPFFPAYQLSSTNHVRTFNKKKNFPYGAICRYRQTSNGIIYNIKDRNGIIRNIDLEQLKRIADSNPDMIEYKTFDQHSLERTKDHKTSLEPEEKIPNYSKGINNELSSYKKTNVPYSKRLINTLDTSAIKPLVFLNEEDEDD